MKASTRVLVVLFGLLLAEASLQIATAVFPTVEARLSGLKPRYVADPVLYVRGDSELPEYDENGFRNEVRPARSRIVVIGDSQTEGSGVARENAWPQQLAARLETSVYQMAFGSYGPGHYLALIDDGLLLEPQFIVVAIYTGNDLAGAYEWVYTNGRNSDLPSGSPEMREKIARAEVERGAIESAWNATREAKKGLYGRPILRWLHTDIEERSKIVALYQQLQWRLSGRANELETERVRPQWSTTLRSLDGVPPDLLFPFDDGTVRTVFTPRARLAAQDLDDARIAEGLRLTVAALERIAIECRDRARLLVLLLPTKENVFAQRVAADTTRPPEAFLQLVRQENEIRARLDAALRERGIDVVDALPVMRALLAVHEPNGAAVNPYPETWDGHPAAAGHAAVSRVVADAISRLPG